MKIKYIETEPIKIKVTFVDKELEDAHNDFIARKRDNLNRIKIILENSEIPAIYRDWLEGTYNFIEEAK